MSIEYTVFLLLMTLVRTITGKRNSINRKAVTVGFCHKFEPTITQKGCDAMKEFSKPEPFEIVKFIYDPGMALCNRKP